MIRMTITPEMASELLKKNESNRKLMESSVSRLAEEMKRGKWKVNGETIKVSKTGYLIDGQHRLHACIKSGVPFTSYVISNLEDEVFDTVDVGVKRSTSQIMQMAGVQNCTVVSAIVKALLEYNHNESFAIGRYVPSSSHILEEYETRPMFYQKFATDFHHIRHIFQSILMAVVIAAVDKYGDDWYDEFFHKLKTGEGLSKGDPAFTLREYGIATKGKNSRQETRAICVKAIKAAVFGNKMMIARFSSHETFPEL